MPTPSTSPAYDSRHPSTKIKRLYSVTISCDFLVWSTSAEAASNFMLSLPMDLVEPTDWYATTKLSRRDTAAIPNYPTVLSDTAYETHGFHPYTPVLVSEDEDVDLDLTVEKAIELDRLAHALGCGA